jgi:ABC-type phosphate transport system substrate-binding protein
VLDGPTVAKIFLGEIKAWNAPVIAKLNPSAKLPAGTGMLWGPIQIFNWWSSLIWGRAGQ